MIHIETQRKTPPPSAVFRQWLSEVFRWEKNLLWTPNYERVGGVYVPFGFESLDYEVIGCPYVVGTCTYSEIRRYRDGTITSGWVREIR